MDTKSITEHRASLDDEDIADSLEERARHIGQAMRALATDMNTYEEHVRPSVIADIVCEMTDFLNASEVGLSLDDVIWDEAFQQFNRLSGVMFGQVLLEVIGHETDNHLAKRFWLDVAEVLGPDHAQTMYRAAVFMTKVA